MSDTHVTFTGRCSDEVAFAGPGNGGGGWLGAVASGMALPGTAIGAGNWFVAVSSAVTGSALGRVFAADLIQRFAGSWLVDVSVAVTGSAVGGGPAAGAAGRAPKMPPVAGMAMKLEDRRVARLSAPSSLVPIAVKNPCAFH